MLRRSKDKVVDHDADETFGEADSSVPEEIAQAEVEAPEDSVADERTEEVREREHAAAVAVERADDPDFRGRKRSPVYVLRRVIREFSADGCTDLAAALTYYSVLAIFPAALALLSVMGLFGDADRSVQVLLDVLRPLVNDDTLDSVEPTLMTFASFEGAGLTFAIGLVGALWSASGYIGAFGRAMNRIYGVEEGRPVWKLRPAQVLLTLATILLCAAALVILIVSGPIAQSIGDVIGLGDTAVQVWNYAKWPALGLLVILIVALLYYFTPNVKVPRFRWVSGGALVAILVWLLASVGFAFFVANFSNYDRTYGAIAGVVVSLLWLWLTNVALMFGAEVDVELERGRELQNGVAAEDDLQLPLRDDRGVIKAAEKRAKDSEIGRGIREEVTGAGDIADRPFQRR